MLAYNYNQITFLTFLIAEEELAAGRSLKIQYPVQVHYNCMEWHDNEACVSKTHIPQNIRCNPTFKNSFVQNNSHNMRVYNPETFFSSHLGNNEIHLP